MRLEKAVPRERRIVCLFPLSPGRRRPRRSRMVRSRSVSPARGALKTDVNAPEPRAVIPISGPLQARKIHRIISDGVGDSAFFLMIGK